VRLVSCQTSSGTLVNCKPERSRVVEHLFLTFSILFFASEILGSSMCVFGGTVELLFDCVFSRENI